MIIFRSSHRRCSVRKSVLKNVAKFTRKRLCQSLFFIKLQAEARVSFFIKLQAEACDFTKKKKGTLTQVFSCKFCEIFKNTFSTEHLRLTASLFPVAFERNS